MLNPIGEFIAQQSREFKNLLKIASINGALQLQALQYSQWSSKKNPATYYKLNTAVAKSNLLTEEKGKRNLTILTTDFLSRQFSVSQILNNWQIMIGGGGGVGCIL